jgi:hypothetical protein
LASAPTRSGPFESQDFEGLAPDEAAVARYALKLTRQPGSITEQDIDDLRAAALSDDTIIRPWTWAARPSTRR